MKVIFVLDDLTIFVSSPEELQLRQLEPGLAAVVMPAGKNEEGQDTFRPLITYPVVLSPVPPPAPISAVATPVKEPTAINKSKVKKNK